MATMGLKYSIAFAGLTAANAQAFDYKYASQRSAACPVGYAPVLDLEECKAGMLVNGAQVSNNKPTWAGWAAGGGCEGTSPGGWPLAGCFKMVSQNSVFMSTCPPNQASGVYSPDLNHMTICGNKPAPAVAGVGGDPETWYGGVKRKFVIPNGELTTLLETDDIMVLATAFQGDSADEQWLDRIVVDNKSGARVVDVQIRRDIDTFDREQETPGMLETIHVHAPWTSTHGSELTFPLEPHEIWQHGPYWEVAMPGFEHPPSIKLDLLRIKNPEAVASHHPRREGILLSSNSVKIAISSASAIEYYFADGDDKRGLKYSHLDMAILDMKDSHTFSGVLPQVWGLQPITNATMVRIVSTDEDTHANEDNSAKTATVAKLASRGDPALEEQSLCHRGLTRKILLDMLWDGGDSTTDAETAAICGEKTV